MASTNTLRLMLRVAGVEVADTSTPNTIANHVFEKIADILAGTSDNQINRAYSKVETGIGSGVTTVYDLIGSLTDKSGSTINFDEVTLIVVENLSTTAANYLLVGPDATNGFGTLAANVGFWSLATDRSVVPAASSTGGTSFTMWFAPGGVPAAAGSTDELAVITGGSASGATWRILIFGRDN